VLIPVGDVDRAESFYTEKLGFQPGRRHQPHNERVDVHVRAIRDAAKRDERQTGPTNLIRFAGQLFDATTGYYDLRAREYDPRNGWFLQPDPLAPPFRQPAISPYVYAHDRPTVLTDPSGMGTEAGGQPSYESCGVTHTVAVSIIIIQLSWVETCSGGYAFKSSVRA
jgi:RHS repeat-associated protein